MILRRFASCRGVIHHVHRPEGAINRAPAGLAWVLPITGIILLLVAGRGWEPWQRLLGATLGLLYLLKLTIFLKHRSTSARRMPVSGILLFFSIWPGMDPSPFRAGRLSAGLDRSLLRRGIVWMTAGLGLLVCVAMAEPYLSPAWIGWMGVAALLMVIHLGYADVLAAAMRRAGWKVGPLFDQPFASGSLTDFWSRRWNLAFVEMDRLLFLRPLRRWFGRSGAILGVFVISGLLHEMAVSYPAGAGWGTPFLYFAIHGFLVRFESHSVGFGQWPSLARRCWTYFWVLAPLPLLFHGPFRDRLIVPLYQTLNELLR